MEDSSTIVTDPVPPASETEPPASDSASAPSAADAARARREARKAKILARGTDRLTRITQAGRGQEGATLYAPAPAPRPTSVASQESNKFPPGTDWSPNPSPNTHNEFRPRQRTPSGVSFGSLASASNVPSPKPSLRPSGAAESGPVPSSPSVPGVGAVSVPHPRVGMTSPDDPLQQFLRALRAEHGQASPDGSGMGAFSPPDVNNLPFGSGPEGAAPGNGMPQNPLEALMAQAGPLRGASSMSPPRKTWLDLVLAWIHLAAIFIFALFTFGAAFTAHWTPGKDGGEPTAQIVPPSHPPRSVLNAWGQLAYGPPDPTDLGAFNLGAHMPLQLIPLFTLFVTLEIILQSGRILRLKSRPQPPSGLIQTVAQQIPVPAVRLLLQTGSQYWSLVSSLLDDIAILVFVLGLAIMAASWRADLR